MRFLLALGAVVLVTAFASPAAAQMCGGAQAQSGSSSMCGGTTAPATPTAGEPKAKSGCGCCQAMAMMQMPMDGQEAPAMEMPAQDGPETTP